MRFFELSEGIRMGAKDLAQPTKKNYTIGFEFEVALRDGFPDSSVYASSDMDAEIDYDQANEDFERYWNNNNTFDFEDWFKDHMRWGYSGGINQFIIDNDLVPKYGWVSDANDYIEHLNIENLVQYNKSKERLEKRLSEYSNEYIEYFKNFYENEYRYNIENFYNDMNKVREYSIIFQMNNPKNKAKEPDDAKRKKAIEDSIEKSTDDRIKFVIKNNIENLANIFFQKINPPYEYTTEDDEYTDFDPNEQLYIYDKNKDVVKIEEEINDLEDLQIYFEIDEDEVRDLLETEWQDAETELRYEEFNTWLADNSGRYSGIGPLAYVSEQLNDELNLNWTVKKDATPGVDAEIESEVFSNLDDGIRSMKEIFEFIQDDPYIYTSTPTGLHINIGTWKGEEIHNVDWLKFLVVYRAEKVLEEFKRLTNTYAVDKLEDIIVALERNNLGPLYDNIEEINNEVFKLSTKQSSLNLSKLQDHGIIELRAPGNTGYETKGQYLEREIKKIGRALDIASNREAYKTEYAKKLYKLLSSQTNKRMGRSPNPQENPVEDFFRQISNGLTIPYKHLGAYRMILYMIENANSFNEVAANSKYTARVHNIIVDDLKEYIRLSGTDVVSGIDSFLNKYDTDSKIRNSRFMNMILKSLGR